MLVESGNIRPVREPGASDFVGLALSEVSYGAYVREPEHLHDQAHFCLCLQGSCTEIYRNRAREYRRFTGCFLPPDHLHSLEYGPIGVRWFHMNIQPEWLTKLDTYSPLRLNPAYLHGGLLTDLFLRLHREHCHPDELTSLVVEALAVEMISEVARWRRFNDRQPPPWLLRARDFLEAHFSDAVRLAMIAEAVDMHPTHLAREFRKHFECTIGDYIRRRRVDYVRRQLEISDASLVDIALAAGFCDQSHLSRTFKRITGITPAEYRGSTRLN